MADKKKENNSIYPEIDAGKGEVPLINAKQFTPYNNRHPMVSFVEENLPSTEEIKLINRKATRQEDIEKGLLN